jgi:hypothetical protein
MILRTCVGCFVTITCETNPQEEAHQVDCSKPSARMKAIASSAMAETVVGVRRSLNPSMIRGSQSQDRGGVVQEDNGHAVAHRFLILMACRLANYVSRA